MPVRVPADVKVWSIDALDVQSTADCPSQRGPRSIRWTLAAVARVRLEETTDYPVILLGLNRGERTVSAFLVGTDTRRRRQKL